LNATTAGRKQTKEINIMPKFIGHYAHVQNRETSVLSREESRRLIKLSYQQKSLLPQDHVFYVMDTSDRGSRGTLAKRWNRWYAMPENIVNSKQATIKMRAKALPKCHVIW
jgi:hypothetical protein